MSRSVTREDQFSGVNSPQTPPDDQHIHIDGQVSSSGVTMKTTTPQFPPGIGAHPAFSLWWERWREARTRVSLPRPQGNIPKRSGATGRVSE
jgi:hypothetical protein